MSQSKTNRNSSDGAAADTKPKRAGAKPKADAKAEAKAEVKADPKAEAKAEAVKVEADDKAEAKPGAKAGPRPRSRNVKEKSPELAKYKFASLTAAFGPKIVDCLKIYGSQNCDRIRDVSVMRESRGDASEDPEKKKKTGFAVNAQGREIIRYICARFTWELNTIDKSHLTDSMSYAEINAWIENGVKEWPFNISQMIITAADKIPINDKIGSSHGLEIELMSNFEHDTLPMDIVYYAARALTRFMKILAFNFSNEFWYADAKQVGIKNFRLALSNLESIMSPGTRTVSAGIMRELTQYIEDVCPAKKGKSGASDDEDNKHGDDQDGGNESEGEAEAEEARAKPKNEPTTRRAKESPKRADKHHRRDHTPDDAFIPYDDE